MKLKGTSPYNNGTHKQQINIDNIICESHGEIANMICIQSQCQNKGILCCSCVYDTKNHKDHQIKALKYFFNDLIKPFKSSQNLMLYTSQIDKLCEDISDIINQKTQNPQQRYELVTAFKQFKKQLNDRIQTEFQKSFFLIQFIQNTYNLSCSELNSFLIKNNFLDEINDIQQNTQKLSIQEKYLIQTKQNLKQKLEDLKELFKTKKYSLNDLLGILTFMQTNQKMNFHFSQTFKHTAIKIKDKLIATQEHNYSANFALIEPMLEGKKKSTKKKSIRIKIDKLNSWITLGICIKNKAIEKNYYFDTGCSTHGAYSISYDGYSWLNDIGGEDGSSQYHGWCFEQGDIIKMTFDPKQKTIKYQKQNSDGNSHQIKYQPQPGQQLYFCVTLNSNDQSVSIVQ